MQYYYQEAQVANFERAVQSTNLFAMFQKTNIQSIKHLNDDISVAMQIRAARLMDALVSLRTEHPRNSKTQNQNSNLHQNQSKRDGPAILNHRSKRDGPAIFIAGTGSNSIQFGNNKSEKVISNPTYDSQSKGLIVDNDYDQNGSPIATSPPIQVQLQASAPLEPIDTRQKAKINRFSLHLNAFHPKKPSHGDNMDRQGSSEAKNLANANRASISSGEQQEFRPHRYYSQAEGPSSVW